MRTRIFLFVFFLAAFVHAACGQAHLAAPGTTIATRFLPPEGYQRVPAAENSFAHYLRHLPLKPNGTLVKYHDGSIKTRPGVYAAVVDMDIGNSDLQQCADAVMRLRAEHLYRQKQYGKIHFRFTNGDNAAYTHYANGHRASVLGNKVTWKKSAGKDYSYHTFRNYLNLVFMYAGTLSLSKELLPVASVREMQIGDVFIKGGSPGHAVIVADMVQHTQTGEKLFLLAQSYMPAQETQVLQNPNSAALNPWYSADFEGRLVTPEWIFEPNQLKRFVEE